MSLYPNGSRFIRFDLNNSNQQEILDAILDGDSDHPITINGVTNHAKKLDIIDLKWAGTNAVLCIIAPKIEKKSITIEQPPSSDFIS